MVFFPQLPTELWFIIYKMEHSSFLSSVNAEIKILGIEAELENNRTYSTIYTIMRSLYRARRKRRWAHFENVTRLNNV